MIRWESQNGIECFLNFYIVYTRLVFNRCSSSFFSRVFILTAGQFIKEGKFFWTYGNANYPTHLFLSNVIAISIFRESFLNSTNRDEEIKKFFFPMASVLFQKIDCKWFGTVKTDELEGYSKEVPSLSDHKIIFCFIINPGVELAFR